MCYDPSDVKFTRLDYKKYDHKSGRYAGFTKGRYTSNE